MEQRHRLLIFGMTIRQAKVHLYITVAMGISKGGDWLYSSISYGVDQGISVYLRRRK
jgi:hypothetical protein